MVRWSMLAVVAVAALGLLGATEGNSEKSAPASPAAPSEMVELRGQVLDPETGKPTPYEGNIRSIRDLSEPLYRMGTMTGQGFVKKLRRDAFPILIRVVNETSAASLVLDKPPEGELTLTMPKGPPRNLIVPYPAEWITQWNGQVYLWLTPKGTIAPATYVKLRLHSPDTGVGLFRPDTGVWGRAYNIPPGEYDILVRFGDKNDPLAWCGTVTVPAEGDVHVALTEKDIKARATLAEMRDILRTRKPPAAPAAPAAESQAPKAENPPAQPSA